MEAKKLLESIKFHINEKANQATSMKNSSKSMEHQIFYHGQYMAFNEVYSMLNNIKL